MKITLARVLPADGFVHGSVHASYLHPHWAGQPSIASRLVAAAL